MRYSFSEYWTLKAREICKKLEMSHVDIERIAVVKSRDSKARATVARIHSLGKVMQLGMQCNAFYVIELLSEKFDKMKEEEKLKVLIHELLHIPHSFGGGFRHHKPFVNAQFVERAFKKLNSKKELRPFNTHFL